MLDYTAQSTVEEAVHILAGAPTTAKVLSGGTDLLVQLRSGRAKPGLIVDIKKIPASAAFASGMAALSSGPRRPAPQSCECEALRRALARGGRGRQSGRLDPGAGSGVACR